MDTKRWIDTTGYPCLARKMRWGSWCGYVGVPETHPLYGLPYNARIKPPPGWNNRLRSLQGIGVIDLLVAAMSGNDPNENMQICLLLECHGGVTFSDFRDEEREHFWFGFDCAHA